MINFTQFQNNKIFIDDINKDHLSFLGETPYQVDFKSTRNTEGIEFRFQRIWKKIKDTKWNLCGKIKNENVIKHKEGLNLYYALIDKHNNPLFVLALDKNLPFNVASYEYHVIDIVKNNSNVYQNELYKFLVLEEDLVLYSDVNQTPNAVKSWERLSNDNNVEVKAIDLSGNSFSGVYKNKNVYLRLSSK